MRWMLAASAMLFALAGCGGGDFCSADVSSLAGTWDVTITSNGDAEVATLVIDADGNVTLTSNGKNDWSCDLVQDQLCDLKVQCKETGGSDEFTFGLSKR